MSTEIHANVRGWPLLHFPSVTCAQQRSQIASAFFLDDFRYLLVDYVFIARQVVPSAQDSDGCGEAGAPFHVRKQEGVGGTVMVGVMNDKIRFGDTVAQRDDFNVAITLAANALVAVLTEDKGFAVLKLENVLAACVFFGQAGPCAIIENIAVL